MQDALPLGLPVLAVTDGGDSSVGKRDEVSLGDTQKHSKTIKNHMFCGFQQSLAMVPATNGRVLMVFSQCHVFLIGVASL